MNKNILFLKTKGKKKDVITKWNSGSVFSSEDATVFITKSSVNKIRDKYERIIILYDFGTLEV